MLSCYVIIIMDLYSTNGLCSGLQYMAGCTATLHVGSLPTIVGFAIEIDLAWPGGEEVNQC